MSVDGETLSAITGMEEACATARARVEDLVAEVDDLRRCLRSVIAQRDEALAEVKTWKHDWYVAKADLGTAMRLADVALRDVAEKYERTVRERDEARASVADAYRRGAEAMREACARQASVCANHRGEELDAILSALPIPEEPC